MALSIHELNEYSLRLGTQIRTFRKLAALTQPELAELAGINAKFLGEVERGKTTLTVNRLIQIASALNISLATLLEPLVMESSPIPKNVLVKLIKSDLENFSEQDLFVIYRLCSFIKSDKVTLHQK